MADYNKENLVRFGKVVLFGFIAFIAGISYAGILNGVFAHGLDKFYAVVGLFNLTAESFGLVTLYRHLFPKKSDKKENVEKDVPEETK